MTATQSETTGKRKVMKDFEKLAPLKAVFDRYHSSKIAFCRQEGIDPSYLRLLLVGKRQNWEIIERAAVFAKAFAEAADAAKNAKKKNALETIKKLHGTHETDTAGHSETENA